MKRRTHNNMIKAVNMIMAKGYDKETANKIAIQCFDNAEQAKNGMPVEWFIEKIATAEEYERAKREQNEKRKCKRIVVKIG